MITLYLESSLFPKDKEDFKFTCKLSYRDQKGKYHNKIVKEDSYNRDDENSLEYQEISSLLLGLRQIKMDNLTKRKLNRTPVKTIRIISSYLDAAFMKNSIKFLFDSWEYINFRGVPYKDLWLQIYDILIQLDKLDIQLLIKEK